MSGGMERCYYLHVPPGYDPTKAVPAVFSFHGFLSNPTSHGFITGWHKLAKEEGFLVVYPQGTSFPQRWDAGETWGVSDVDDVAFFTDMIEADSANFYRAVGRFGRLFVELEADYYGDKPAVSALTPQAVLRPAPVNGITRKAQ